MTAYAAGPIGAHRKYRYATQHHILAVDHRYGPFENIAWGRTLCGLEGRVEGKDMTLAEAHRSIAAYYGCARCMAAASKKLAA